MTKKIINTGVSANDGSGDTLRQAAGKINDNFDELYGVLDSGLEEAPEDSSDYVRRNAAWVSTSKYVDIDAPGDGTPYARQDSDWVSIPANIEAPTDSIYYGRINSGWQPVTEEAPDDSNDYVRNSKAWSQLTIDVLEAPTDGNAYVRQSSDWTLLDSVNKVPEAPNDGQTYARQSKDWLDVTAFLSTVIPEAPTDGKMYGRQSSDWEISVEEAPEDSVPYARYNTTWVDVTPEVTNPPTDTIVYGRQDSSWVEVLTDAPGDSTAYGRMDSAWVAVTEEAPIDSVPYARYNGTWVNSTPDVLDAPADSVAYGRYNSDWTAVLTDAPSDSDFYARYNGSWIRVPGESPNVPDAVYGRGDSTWALVTPEAPIDGLPYGRLDAEWVDVTPDVGEAPTDDLIYGRLNGNWSVIAIDSTVTGNFLTDAPGDGQEYVRKDSAWEVATGGGGGGGAASSVDTFVCSIDSLSYNANTFGYGYGDPFYERIYTVGTTGDFQNIHAALAHVNSKPDNPLHTTPVRISIDCAGYDLFDSAGYDSDISGSISMLRGKTALSLNNFNYRLRIAHLNLDSSAKFGTLPGGFGSGRFSVNGGTGTHHGGGDQASEPSFNYGYGAPVLFDSCSITGQWIDVQGGNIEFRDCVWDSNSRILGSQADISLDTRGGYGYGTPFPAINIANSSLFARGDTFRGEVGLKNSYLEINKWGSPFNFHSVVNLVSSTLNFRGSSFSARKDLNFINSSMFRGTYGTPDNFSVTIRQQLRLGAGSHVNLGDGAYGTLTSVATTSGANSVRVQGGSTLSGGRWVKSGHKGAGIILDKISTATFEQVPSSDSASIDGTIINFDSAGASGFRGKYGSSLYFDSAI